MEMPRLAKRKANRSIVEPGLAYLL